MPRQPRIQFPGACYHVMARGNRREPIVLDDQDRGRFLDTFAQACARTGWEVYAWALMDHHYHFAFKTPEPNLVAGMSWFQNTWTRRFNTRHAQWGHLFGGRYKAILVEATDTRDKFPGSQTDYLSTLINDVHLNPVRAGLVNPSDQTAYPWSSLAKGYGIAPSKRPQWLEVQSGLSILGYSDSVSERRSYLRHLEQMASAEAEEVDAGLIHPEGQGLQSTLRRGWYWGSEAFKERLLEMLPDLSKMTRAYQSSRAGRSRSWQDAEDVLKDCLNWFRISESELIRLPRGDQRKVAVAWTLCRLTCVRQQWVADRLAMKSCANVSQQIRRFESLPDRRLPVKTRQWRKRILKIVT